MGPTPNEEHSIILLEILTLVPLSGTALDVKEHLCSCAESTLYGACVIFVIYFAMSQ